MKYTTTPDNDEVLLELDNSSKKVQVKSTGNATSLKLVGTTTVTYTGLELTTEYTAIRLTIDASGDANMYVFEIVEDDDGANNYKSVAGASGSSKAVKWGNTSGNVSWGNVYACTSGAFGPDELSSSEFVNDNLVRLGFGVRDQLRNSERPFLKNFIDNSSIVYGSDFSSGMLNRIGNPAIYVVISEIASPDFTVLGGSRADTHTMVHVYIVARGSSYNTAYRRCIDLTGDVFDELYVNTGLDAQTDSLVTFGGEFDVRYDKDEVVCVHHLKFDYLRRILLNRR